MSKVDEGARFFASYYLKQAAYLMSYHTPGDACQHIEEIRAAFKAFEIWYADKPENAQVLTKS